MRIRNILYIALKSMKKRAYVFILLLVISTFALYVMDELITNYAGPVYRLKLTEEAYRQGVNNSYIVAGIPPKMGETIDVNAYKRLITYLYDIDKFRVSGLFWDGQATCEYNGLNYSINVECMDKSLVEFGKINIDTINNDGVLYLRKDVDCYNQDRKKESAVEVFCNADEQSKGFAGYLSEDSLFSRERSIDYFNLSLVQPMGIELYDKSSIMEELKDGRTIQISRFAFSFDEKLTKEERDDVINSIEKFALDNNIIVSIKCVADDLEEAYNTLGVRNKEKFVGTIMIIILAIASIMSATVNAVLLKKKEYGIMYSVGISKNSIAWSIIIQNGIVIFISVLISYIYRHLDIMAVFYEKAVFPEYYLDIHIRVTLSVMILVGILILIVSNILPMFILHKTAIADLVKDVE